ncbi:MAG: hypothetical protein ACRETL_03275, partial [Gammaproteobacteria bacterium]
FGPNSKPQAILPSRENAARTPELFRFTRSATSDFFASAFRRWKQRIAYSVDGAVLRARSEQQRAQVCWPSLAERRDPYLGLGDSSAADGIASDAAWAVRQARGSQAAASCPGVSRSDPAGRLMRPT